MRVWRAASIALWAAAEAVIVAAVGSAALPLLAAWAAAAGVVAIVGALLPGRAARLGAAIPLLGAMIVLTFEGGLFFVPATIALIVAAALSGSETSSETGVSAAAR